LGFHEGVFLQILILGGTRFLGRHLVEAALAQGHEVTLFHRGQTNPDVFPQLEHIRGDRTRDLAPLRARRWDIVLDTCGYTPRAVHEGAQQLADATEHYTFISTISVYRQPLASGTDETAAASILADHASREEVTLENYGELKVLCEGAVQEVFPGRSLIIRAGLLVGPYDPTDRFPYWIRRIAAGGDVVAPLPATRPVQFIHARDISDWIIRMVEGRRSGVYNATGPARPLSMEALLTTIRETLGTASTLAWVPEGFLLEQGVSPWADLPLWLPSAQNAFMEVSIERAFAAGLSVQPLEQTVREIHEWQTALNGASTQSAGLSREREAAVLTAWKAREKH